jgi:heme-degrading monooxygenase HmoA
MYTVIRRYEGISNAEEVVRRASEEFGPQLAGQPGFQGYWVVDGGDGVIASITVFDTEAAAEESTKAAASWVQEQLAELVPNAPQITAGATTGVAAAAHA